MSDISIKDTTAYRIVREITDHVFGSDQSIDDEGAVWICKAFNESGGSWERILRGSSGDLSALEKIIELFIKTNSDLLVSSLCVRY